MEARLSFSIVTSIPMSEARVYELLKQFDVRPDPRVGGQGWAVGPDDADAPHIDFDTAQDMA
jgi:hypothetical protein